MKEWGPTLEGELKLDLYRHVSGICLFRPGYIPTDRGETNEIETSLITNQVATHRLPDWLESQFPSPKRL
jgi:hypothetical protein